MERIKRILLLLTLSYWLLPQPVLAQEKYEPDFSNYEEPEIQVMDKSWGDEQVAYQNWLKAKQKKSYTKVVSSTTRVTTFAAGYCTDYVARRVTVTWRGNAGRWAANASAQGYLVDKNPVVGGILVTRESRVGHVAYIEIVNGTKVTISEWNYAGQYILTTRTLDISNPIIIGVIHL